MKPIEFKNYTKDTKIKQLTRCLVIDSDGWMDIALYWKDNCFILESDSSILEDTKYYSIITR